MSDWFYDGLVDEQPECPTTRVRWTTLADRQTLASERPQCDAPPSAFFEPRVIRADDDARAWRIDYTKAAIDLAETVDAPAVCLATGRPPPGTLPETAHGYLRESLHQILDYAEPRGIDIGIEFEPELLVENTDEVLELVDDVGRESSGSTSISVTRQCTERTSPRASGSVQGRSQAFTWRTSSAVDAGSITTGFPVRETSISVRCSTPWTTSDMMASRLSSCTRIRTSLIAPHGRLTMRCTVSRSDTEFGIRYGEVFFHLEALLSRPPPSPSASESSLAASSGSSSESSPVAAGQGDEPTPTATP